MAKRRVTRNRRSAAEWGVRGALAIMAAGSGTVSVAHTLAYVMRGSAPAQAHALAPWDGRITALLSEQLSGPEVTLADRGRADELARLALRQDPTAVAAVATLGINAQVRGDTAEARRIFAYSEKLSRRDLRTRLWANEDAVVRGDIPGALRNYDIALRTSRVAPDLLFPVLSKAIDDDEIRGELVRTLAARPLWGEQFLAYVSGNGPATRSVARLFEALQEKRIFPSEGAATALIQRLIAEGRYDDAWRYYASITPGADRRRSRDGDFSSNRTAPSAFDWKPVDDTGISVTIQRNGDGGLLDFSVPSGLGGPLLDQLQLLPSGTYEIEGHSIGIAQPDAALPYWLLRCANGRELGRVIVPASAKEGGRFAGRFTVPVDCPVQHLTLMARPGDQMSGLTGQIDDVRLHPVRT